MKNKHFARRSIIIIILCLALIASLSVEIAQSYKASYEVQATVVSYDGDTAVAETADGNLWGYCASHVVIGEQVILVMNDSHTPKDIFDDRIIEVK